MNAITVGKSLVCIKLLENRVFILLRSSLDARSVGTLLDIIKTLIYVGEFILV